MVLLLAIVSCSSWSFQIFTPFRSMRSFLQFQSGWVRLPAICVRLAAGMVTGPSVSPIDAACGQRVACGEGAVLKVEDADNRVLRGRAHSEQPWTGKCWQDE
jgi:hypothetical protein